MELGIDTLHVDESNLLLQDHLVECANEECIQETSVENGQTDHTTDELEVSKMLRVDPRVRVDLESVVVVCRVLEQAVERVEHLVRKQEEEFTVAVSTSSIKNVGTRPLTEKDHRNLNHLRHRT